MGLKSDNMKRSVFLTVWAVFAVLYFLAEGNGIVYDIILKALPELWIIVALAASRRHIESRIFVPVILALVFSVLGDTAGEFKFGKGLNIAFVIQIACFLVAQVFYTVSFARNIKRQWWEVPAREKVLKSAAFLAVISYMSVVAVKVISSIDSAIMIIACCLYLLALLASGTSSIMQSREKQYCFVLGAMLFIFSDSVIALNSFVGRIPDAGLIIMSTYFLAQFLLNVSLVKENKS